MAITLFFVCISTEYEISSNGDMICYNNMSGCVSLFHQVFMLPVSLIFWETEALWTVQSMFSVQNRAFCASVSSCCILSERLQAGLRRSFCGFTGQQIPQREQCLIVPVKLFHECLAAYWATVCVCSPSGHQEQKDVCVHVHVWEKTGNKSVVIKYKKNIKKYNIVVVTSQTSEITRI